MLRSEPIVDGHDDAARVLGQADTPNVLGVEITRDEPAAVEVHEARRGIGTPRRLVDTNPDVGRVFAGPGRTGR